MSLLPNAVASSSTSSLVAPLSAMTIPSPTAPRLVAPLAPSATPEADVSMTDASRLSCAPSQGPFEKELVDLYKKTHDEFWATYTTIRPSSTADRDKYFAVLSKPSNDYHHNHFDPEEDMLVIDDDMSDSAMGPAGGGGAGSQKAWLGGGDSCTTNKDAFLRDITCVSGKFALKEWSATKVCEPSYEGEVLQEPPYVFARSVKRLVAIPEEKTMTYEPTFAVESETILFNREAYKELFDELEISERPDDFPLVDCICYEYLNRVLHLYPHIELRYIDSLGFLPSTTTEITNMPLHNDMIRFPQPNPSSHLFPVPDPKPEGENVRHKLIDDRWLAGEKTHIGILRDSESTFCPEPSCGEYDCQLHTPFWEGVGPYVNPKEKGDPLTVHQLFLKVQKKGCGPDCFTKSFDCKAPDFKAVLHEKVTSTPNWSDEEIEQLMGVIQMMPTLFPCKMVDILVDDLELPKYTCLDYFIHRCKIMDLVEPRPSHTIPLRRSLKNNNKRPPFDLAHMRPTRPCNHEGSCSVAECECHRNKVYCTINCHCSPSDCPRRHPGCNCKGKGTAKCQTRSCKCFQDGRECDPLLCGSCGARDTDGGSCNNVQIQQGHRKRVVVGPSKHGLGLYLAADETADKEDLIIEYTGDIISEHESAKRGLIYEQGHRNYQFDLNFSQAVDAQRRGNDSRFINQPDAEFRRRERSGRPGEANCYPRIIHVLGQHRIALFALDHIEGGTELLFDYGKSFEFKPTAAKSARETASNYD